MISARRDSLDLRTLTARYAAGTTTPGEVLQDVRERIDSCPTKGIWIELTPPEDITRQIERILERKQQGIKQPLFGVPFAVKDNIDAAGRKTTVACPDFAYQPEQSAAVVARLCDAGAIVVGKTNLDQFATGLVGVRSPYGVCRNPFDPQYISGGSSSGSAVAVAAGLVSFSLGTDTAGSGRVPAAFNNIVGLKPTRGLMSTSGVVPACRSLDCVSVFTLTCEDAATVAAIASAYDPTDIYARTPEEISPAPVLGRSFRFGIPAEHQLQFFGDESGPALFRQAVERLQSIGGTPVRIDYAPFAQAARLLYEGPWLAERIAAIKGFITRQPESMLPLIRSIIGAAEKWTAVDTFEGIYQLRRFIRLAAEQWKQMDMLVLPTAGRIYTIDEVEREPLALNLNLGYYTNFVNLMDLCAVAVPCGFDRNGLPAGISLIAPANCDGRMLEMGDRLQRAFGFTLGATGNAIPEAAADAPAWVPVGSPVEQPVVSAVERSTPPAGIRIAVVGAHLSGQPLNHQLTNVGATLVQACRTSPHYRLIALPGTVPPKPGLVRVGKDTGAGASIDLEVWEMGAEPFARFVAAIPPPLGIGTIELEDGSSVKGFLCEDYVTVGARDISAFGGWRQYLSSL